MTNTFSREAGGEGIPLVKMTSNRIYEPGDELDGLKKVESGEINLFLIESDEKGNELGRMFLVSLIPGDWCFFMAPMTWKKRQVRLAAVPSVDSSWRQYPLSCLTDSPVPPEDMAKALNAWLNRLAERLCTGLPPASSGSISPESDLIINDGALVSPGRVPLWLQVKSGRLRPLGTGGNRGNAPLAPVEAGSAAFLSPPLWYVTEGETRLTAQTTLSILKKGDPGACLQSFHRLIMAWLIQRHEESILNRSRTEAEDNEFAEKHMYAQLHSLADLAGAACPEPGSESDPVQSAFTRIAKECHLPLEFTPEEGWEKEPLYDRILRHTVRNRWRMRRVALPRDFHRTDAGVFIAFRKETASMAVLILRGREKSLLFDPQTGKERPLTRQDTGAFDKMALKFHDLLPERKLSWRDLARFIFRGSTGTFISLLIVGIISGLIGLVMPVAMEYVTGSIIPSANMPELWQIMILLIFLTASSVLFGLVPQLIMLSFGTSRFERFQTALCDRLLRLPVNFFRQFDVGDLTSRILAATRIQETLFGVVSNQFLGALFSLGSLIMMFYYSPRLAGVAVVVEVIFAGSLLLLYQRNLKPMSTSLAAEGRLSGILVQMIEGMAKIRSFNAEKRVISRYLEDFSTAVKADYSSNVNGSIVNVASIVFPGMVSILLFLLIGRVWKGILSVPEFMAFMSAYAGFQQGLLGLVNDVWTLQAIRPELKRLQPVLEESPEVAAGMQIPDRLDGRVELVNVSFRYRVDSPLILDNVSLSAEPGEFIAIVGTSGAGKSTLVRLLLGFEKPESGGVYYSGHELSSMDVRAVRRQLGVILQNSRVLPDSILDNITKGTDYTMQEAMQAMELAAMKEEMEAMPMGIHTLVSDTLISGGQQQRILIARALVGNPAVVIMDESTSALDNATQEIVRKNMEQLHFTRIVIAHRLSTIINADRIYVLNEGRICQTGTFSELMAQEGVFRKLASRQIL